MLFSYWNILVCNYISLKLFIKYLSIPLTYVLQEKEDRNLDPLNKFAFFSIA